MAKPNYPGKPGRKPAIDIDQLEALGELQCTIREVAAYFHVSHQAVEQRLEKPEYRAAWERGSDRGKISLRRAQLRVALNGNPTMLIWLGKQLLGQRDVQWMEGGAAGGQVFQVNILQSGTDGKVKLEELQFDDSAVVDTGQQARLLEDG
jgi:hypothetical protein